MDERKKFTYWLEHAQYDQETARAMLQTRRWMYVAREIPRTGKEMRQNMTAAIKEKFPTIKQTRRR